MIVIKNPKTFCFNFDLLKYVDDNLKYEFELIIKCNESLADNKIKKGIEQLFSKYKNVNNIHEHIKQQNE